MPFSPFDDLGFWQLGASAPSYAEQIYEQLCAGVTGAYDLSVGTYEEAKLYATAMLFGHARMVLDSARGQRLPSTVTDLLPDMEKDFGGIVPPAGASLEQRRAKLEALALLMRGSREEAITTELRSILGDAFVKLRVRAAAERAKWPASPAAIGAWPPPDRTPKYFRLLDTVASTGLHTLGYEPLNDSAAPFVGEFLCVEPEINTVTEAVVVTAVTSLSPGVTYPTFTASFTQPHSAGAMALNAKPVWTGTAREVLVIITTAAARDPEMRRRVNEAMARHMKTSTRWRIVETADRTTIGPFIVGLSKVGTVPIGPAAVPI